jgi:hypothetical protein
MLNRQCIAYNRQYCSVKLRNEPVQYLNEMNKCCKYTKEATKGNTEASGINVAENQTTQSTQSSNVCNTLKMRVPTQLGDKYIFQSN